MPDSFLLYVAKSAVSIHSAKFREYEFQVDCDAEI